MEVIEPECFFCEHFKGTSDDTWVCSAFSTGIPQDIILGRELHRSPYQGDMGIQFSPDFVHTRDPSELTTAEVIQALEGQAYSIYPSSLGNVFLLDVDETSHLWQKLGGPGSGHWGHAGRRGKRGGSLPRSTAMSIKGKDWEQRQRLAKKALGTAPDVTYPEAKATWKNTPEHLHIVENFKDYTTNKFYNPDNTIWDDDLRANIKSEIAKNLSDATDLTYQEATDMVHQWALSSNDDDYRSLSIQEAAADEFGIELSSWQAGKIAPHHDFNLDERRELYEENMRIQQDPANAAIVGEVYDKAAKGLYPYSDVPMQLDQHFPGFLDRDIRLGTLGGPPKTSDMSLQPMAAQQQFLREMYNQTQTQLKGMDTMRLYRGVDVPLHQKPSTGDVVPIETNAVSSWSVNPTTAYGFGTVLLAIDIPTSRVLSTCRTGFGCLGEYEVTVLGGKGDQAKVVVSR